VSKIEKADLNESKIEKVGSSEKNFDEKEVSVDKDVNISENIHKQSGQLNNNNIQDNQMNYVKKDINNDEEESDISQSVIISAEE